MALSVWRLAGGGERTCAADAGALMQRLDGRLIVSAHDLVGYLGCEHLTGLDLDVAEGKREKPAHFDDPQLDLLQKRGFEHEKRCLERLGAEGCSVREIAKPGFTFEGLENAEKETLAAMREGIGVVYQGTLLGDGRWRGHPDFLVRVEEPSDLGPWSYEPADAKLARGSQATALLQLLRLRRPRGEPCRAGRRRRSTW